MKVLTACLVGVFAAVVLADVDLEWRAPDAVPVGATVELGLYAVAETETPVCAVDVIFEWSPGLDFLGVPQNPYDAYQWMLTDFPVGQPGFDGLNDTWLDGNAYWAALAAFGEPFIATPEGALIAMFEFQACDNGTVDILPDVGGYAFTAVWDAETAGNNIVGELGSVAIIVDDSFAPTAHAPPTFGAEDEGDATVTELRR